MALLVVPWAVNHREIPSATFVEGCSPQGTAPKDGIDLPECAGLIVALPNRNREACPLPPPTLMSPTRLMMIRHRVPRPRHSLKRKTWANALGMRASAIEETAAENCPECLLPKLFFPQFSGHPSAILVYEDLPPGPPAPGRALLSEKR